MSSTPQARSPEFSNHVQGWVSDEQFSVLQGIADRLTERTGVEHRRVDALRWVLDRGTLKSFAEGRRASV